MSVPRTFSDSTIQGFRNWHAKAEGYGCHEHPYLHNTIRMLADEMTRGKQASPTLFDYGCGKGAFLDRMRRLNIFGEVVGYDPAVDAYRIRPRGTYDLVTCLDVIDIVEPRFIDAFLEDIAGFTAGVAIFVVSSRPPPESGLKPHPPFYWSLLVGRRMRVIETKTDFTGMDGFGRAVIKAIPQR